MRVTALGLGVAIACLFGASGITGQQRPDLSGTWKAVADAPPGLPAAQSPVFGERFAVQQTAEAMTVVRPFRDTGTTAIYSLTGTETNVRIPGGLCLGDAESVEKVMWEGDALAHLTVGYVPPGGGTLTPRNIKRLFRFQAPDTLVVEGTTTQGGQARQVGTVYKRSTEPIPTLAEFVKGPQATIAQVAWVGGVWVGAAGQTTVEERWTPVSGGSSIGVSRTIRNNAMSAFEFLCIVERGGTLVYSAMPNGRSPATHFTATSVTADSVTFENPSHDFPKMIRYSRKADGSLETMIAGAGGAKPQTVTLRKQE